MTVVIIKTELDQYHYLLIKAADYYNWAMVWESLADNTKQYDNNHDN